MKFLHSADIHLDSPLRGLDRYEFAPVDQIRGATRRAFENLVQLALEERVEFLLIAGDLYDGDWQDYNTGLFFSRQMSRLREGGIPVFVIQGNHDADSRLTKELRLPDNVRIFPTHESTSHRLENLEVVIHGRGFPTAAVRENIMAAFPAAVPGWFNIGLLHTSATGFSPHENYAPCSLSDLESKRYDYWALGHVHVRAELKQGDPWVVFPGNLQGRHAKETGSKGATMVTVEYGRVLKVEHCPLDVVRWAQLAVDVSGCETLDDVLAVSQNALEQERVRADGRLLAAQVALRGACAAHGRISARPEQFLNQLRSLTNDLGNVWLERVRIETSECPPRHLQGIIREDNLGPLFREARQLWDNPHEIASLADELEPLKKKLPPELLEELRLNDPAQFRALLAEAEQLLLPRIYALNTPT